MALKTKFEARLDRHAFDQPDVEDFEQLEDSGLAPLIISLYRSIEQGKGLQRTFRESLGKHGIIYAVEEQLRVLPYKLTGFMNSILPGIEESDISPDKLIKRPVIRDGKLDAEYSDPGSFARLVSLLPGYTVQNTPLWTKNNLGQARERNVMKIYAETMELAERVSQIGDGADRDSIVSKIQSAAKGFLNRTANYHAINDMFGEVLESVKGKIDQRELELIYRLHELQSGDKALKHKFTRKFIEPYEKKIKSAENKEDVFRQTVSDRISSAFQWVASRQPLVYASLVGVALALGGGLLVKNGVYNYLQHQDKNRVSEVARVLPPDYEGLGAIIPFTVHAANTSHWADQAYVAQFPEESEIDVPLNDGQLYVLLDSHIETGLRDSGALLELYRDSRLINALDAINNGGGTIINSFSHWYTESGHMNCTTRTDSDGNTTETCYYVCDSRTHFQSKDQGQINQGVEMARQGLATEVFGEHFGDIFFPVIDVSQYVNADTTAVRDYLAAAQGQAQLPATLESNASRIAQLPDSDVFYDWGCWYGYGYPPYWEPRSLAGQIYGLTNDVQNFSSVSSYLEKANEALQQGSEIMHSSSDAETIFKEEMGDFSIYLHKALGIPGAGHLFQDEIKFISNLAGIGMGIIGIAAAYGFYNSLMNGMFGVEMGNIRRKYGLSSYSY
ncbi:hypothetical protein QT06_C0001G0138 [archaeon GW2011_AR15]|nr:hypothetical protein QT06_C0001G0138 [archaeon GW2011_AR15]